MDESELESLTTEELTQRYDALLDALFTLECPPDIRDERERVLSEQAYAFSMEIARRGRFGRSVAVTS